MLFDSSQDGWVLVDIGLFSLERTRSPGVASRGVQALAETMSFLGHRPSVDLVPQSMPAVHPSNIRRVYRYGLCAQRRSRFQRRIGSIIGGVLHGKVKQVRRNLAGCLGTFGLFQQAPSPRRRPLTSLPDQSRREPQ